MSAVEQERQRIDTQIERYEKLIRSGSLPPEQLPVCRELLNYNYDVMESLGVRRYRLI